MWQVCLSPIAAAMAMQYTLQTTKAKDKTGLMRVLGILAQNIRGHPFEVSDHYVSIGCLNWDELNKPNLS